MKCQQEESRGINLSQFLSSWDSADYGQHQYLKIKKIYKYVSHFVKMVWETRVYGYISIILINCE